MCYCRFSSAVTCSGPYTFRFTVCVCACVNAPSLTRAHKHQETSGPAKPVRVVLSCRLLLGMWILRKSIRVLLTAESSLPPCAFKKCASVHTNEHHAQCMTLYRANPLNGVSHQSLSSLHVLLPSRKPPRLPGDASNSQETTSSLD